KEQPTLAETGGGEKFLELIGRELIPHLESSLRVGPYRILVGHSLGGLMAVHAFLARPPPFQALVAIDPSLWWDDQLGVRKARERPPATAPKGALYVAGASHTPRPGEKDNMQPPQRELVRLLGEKAAAARVQFHQFDDEDHGSVPLIALYHGLRFVFAGF